MSTMIVGILRAIGVEVAQLGVCQCLWASLSFRCGKTAESSVEFLGLKSRMLGVKAANLGTRAQFPGVKVRRISCP